MDKKIKMIGMLLGMFALYSGLYGLTGEDVLNKVENTLNGPKNYEGTAKMTLANLDESQKELRVLKMWMSGKDKRLIKFLAPAAVNGIGLLVENENEMYLYLPAQSKIRRIEGGIKNDDFQGTDFSYNEMGSYEYKNDYEASVASEDAKLYTLNLKLKKGSDRVYDKIVMTVDKADFVPQKLELYKNNALVKIMSIGETHQNGKYIIPSRIRVENVQKKHYTEMTLENVLFDQDLEGQSVFSKRYLKKKEK